MCIIAIQGQFVIPKPLIDPSKTFNKALVVGYIQNAKSKDGERAFFDEYTKSTGENYYMFTADVRAGDNLVRLKGFNTHKSPTHARDLAEIVDVGMKVKVEGSLSESFDEKTGKIYREILVWNIVPADDSEQPRTAVVLQGFIDSLNYSLSDGLDLVLNIPTLAGEKRLYHIKGSANNEYVQWLLKQNYSEGDTIKVNCYWLNSVIRDDFDEILEVNNYLDLVRITHYHSVKASGAITKLPNLPF